MKKVIVLFVAVITCSGIYAQQKAKPAPKVAPVAKPKTAPAAQPTMKTALDSLSYALGLSLAEFYKQQGIKTVNTTLVSKAINDAMKGGKTLLNEEQMNNCITNYMQKVQAEKAAEARKTSAAVRKTGETFLAENKTKQGVVTLPSGLQYQVIKEGTGAKPTINDTVRCHYTGTLIDGTKFDSSVDRGEPVEFPVGGVIKGWVEALQLMPVGSKWKLFIPSELAYGDNQAGPTIAPGSTLIFDVELLDIVKH